LTKTLAITAAYSHGGTKVSRETICLLATYSFSGTPQQIQTTLSNNSSPSSCSGSQTWYWVVANCKTGGFTCCKRMLSAYVYLHS